MSHCTRSLALIITLTAASVAGCEPTIESLLPAVPDPCADAPAPGEVVTVTRNAPATTEGLVFGIDERLYVSTERAVHVMTPEGEFEAIGVFPSALGLRAEPGRLLVTGFETAELHVMLNLVTAVKSAVAGGLDKPNFVVTGPRSDWLVCDDVTDRISEVTPAGDPTLWTQAVSPPNGMAGSPDRRTF